MANPLDLVNTILGEWAKTSQPLKERLGMYPLGQYQDGRIGMAWPGFATSPVEAGKRAYDSGMPLSTTDPEAAEAAYRDMGEVALGTMLGGSVASMGSGAARGAVGMAGGKLTGDASKKAFRDYLNQKHPFNPAENNKRGDGGNYGQRKAPYGDYLWRNDRGQFDFEYQEWLKKQGDGGDLSANAKSGAAVPLAANALERAGADLPMDLASRMARAREMGFDIDNVLYHGTRAGEFPEFSPSQSGTLGPGTYLTNSAANAGDFARFASGDNGPAVMPLMARGQMADMAEYNALMDETLPYRDAQREAIRILQDAGYSGLRSGNEVSVFDPRNIRSTSAAFDPARSDSANLLAANAKSGAAVPLAADGSEQQDPQTTMLANLIKRLMGGQ